ncbi:MAG: hypothetical protein ACLP59_06515 [Bryobacteraceae bacterium]
MSCATNNAPQPGTPGFYWTAAKQTYAAGDYQKASESLVNIVSGQNEYVERALPWTLVLTSGMAQGYLDLAKAFDAGAHINRAQVTNFRRQASTYRGNANTLALQFAEAFAKFQGKDEYVTLSFPYPTGSPTEDQLIGKVEGGAWLRDADLEAVQKHAIERAVLLATCRAAGAKNDPAKVLDMLKNSDAKVPRAAFMEAMASALFEQSQLYAHNAMDQPDKMKVFCDRAEDALKGIPSSKESQDLDKKIRAAMKKAKG